MDLTQVEEPGTWLDQELFQLFPRNTDLQSLGATLTGTGSWRWQVSSGEELRIEDFELLPWRFCTPPVLVSALRRRAAAQDSGGVREHNQEACFRGRTGRKRSSISGCVGWRGNRFKPFSSHGTNGVGSIYHPTCRNFLSIWTDGIQVPEPTTPEQYAYPQHLQSLRVPFAAHFAEQLDSFRSTFFEHKLQNVHHQDPRWEAQNRGQSPIDQTPQE